MASFTEWNDSDMVFLKSMKAVEEVAQAAKVMNEWFGAGGDPVPSSLSEQRADICKRCPKNNNGGWWNKSKSAAASIIRRHLETKKLLRIATSQDEHLHSCDVCGCVLKLKVHVPWDFARSSITPKQEQEFRSVNCWLITEKGPHTNEL